MQTIVEFMKLHAESRRLVREALAEGHTEQEIRDAIRADAAKRGITYDDQSVSDLFGENDLPHFLR